MGWRVGADPVMTQPKEATLEREKDVDLYVTDAQMIRKLNVPEAVIRPVIKMLDADPKKGFPKKDPLFGGRRYWPKVRAWFDDYNRFNMQPPQQRRQA